MKQTLLIAFLALFSFTVLAHSSPIESGVLPLPVESIFPNPTKISVYPNPATNYISIDQDEDVKQIVIFNLVGRKMMSINDVEKDQQYDVSNLPRGMYLVRIVDNSNKIITTQRISKR